MQSQEVPYERNIFVCTNDCQGEKPSCGDHQGALVFQELRRIAKERGHHPRIRVTQAKCLGQCNQGANIMIFPDNKWHSGVTMDNIPQLADKYL